jgi:hypothetical protein
MIMIYAGAYGSASPQARDQADFWLPGRRGQSDMLSRYPAVCWGAA